MSFEKIAADQLLGDGRSALRKDRGDIQRVPASHLRRRASRSRILSLETTRANPEYSTPLWEKKFLSSAAQEGIANNGRDVIVSGDLAVFRGHFGKGLAVDIVDVADGGKLELVECLPIGEVGSIEVNVMDGASSQSESDDGRAGKEARGAAPPRQATEAAGPDSPDGRQGPCQYALQVNSTGHGQAPEAAQGRSAAFRHKLRARVSTTGHGRNSRRRQTTAEPPGQLTEST